MIRSHFTATVPRLIIRQPQILFSASLGSYCFCIVGISCPIKIDVQDILSDNVVKEKCATLLTVNVYNQCHKFQIHANLSLRRRK